MKRLYIMWCILFVLFFYSLFKKKKKTQYHLLSLELLTDSIYLDLASVYKVFSFTQWSPPTPVSISRATCSVS